MEHHRVEDYALGHSDQELERLAVQARLLAPVTERFLVEAGLAPGMRVLDVGSGMGDVSFLASKLVGSRGEVVGLSGDMQNPSGGDTRNPATPA